jgi:hypothetical protein
MEFDRNHVPILRYSCYINPLLINGGITMGIFKLTSVVGLPLFALVGLGINH